MFITMSTITNTFWVPLLYQIHPQQSYKTPSIFCKPLHKINLKSSNFTTSVSLNQTTSPKINSNEKIRQFCETGKLKEAVNALFEYPKLDIDLGTYCVVLQLCAEQRSLFYGRKVHSVISSNSWRVDSVLGAKLVFMYVNCGDLDQGRKIFDQIANEKAYLWNILINGYAKVGNFEEGVRLYHKMKEFGVEPNSYTFSCVFKCFSGLGSLQEGERAHGWLVKLHLDTDNAVVNSLISFYFTCRRVNSAQKLFDKSLDRDIISWNSMISGYSSNGLPKKGIEFFKKMLEACLIPNSTTLVCVLSACADSSVVEFGRVVHGYMLKTGFIRDLTCNNTLLDMYSKCGDLGSSILVFENMADKSVVSWTTMIAGYAREGQSGAAMRLFHQMRDEAVEPNAFIVTTVLNACASSNMLDNGKEIHDYVRRNKMDSDLFISNALMDMYMKCRSIEDAQSVFNQMSIRDIVSWNTMIGGFSRTGYPNEALRLFLEMQHESKPDCVTISSILPSCASISALERGREIHAHILRNGQIYDPYVANALVDMYVKCGALVLACSAFDMISNKDLISWTSMISGYCLHGLGNEAINTFIEMTNDGVEPNENSFSCILHGCCHSGLLDEGRRFFSMMDTDYGIKPKLEQYTCMVHLLANAGKLTEAYKFIEKMPLKADAEIWGVLLQGCRIHHDLKLSEKVAEHIFKLDPENAASYMLVANIYSEAKIWEKVTWLKNRIGHLGKEKNPVCTWIEVKGKVQIFFAGNASSHPEYKKIETLLKKIKFRMSDTSYTRKTKYSIHDKDEIEKEAALCGHSEMSAIAFGVLNLAPGSTIRVTKNSRVCHECHDMAKCMSKTYRSEIILRDSQRFHHFKDAMCSCRS